MEVYKGVRIYHSLARFYRKKVLKGELSIALFFCTKEYKMGDIQDALVMFQHMMGYKYNFVVSYKKTAYQLELSFAEKDFRHMAGLHYLKDIDIPKTPKVLFDKIRNEKINDEYLKESVYYLQIEESHAKVKDRISGLNFLEQFLDSKNLICKYVKYRNIYSSIDADYLIKSTVNHITAYIFLRRRNKESNDYCICSFFIEPESEYNGISVYWLYKSKIDLSDGSESILYNRLKI